MAGKMYFLAPGVVLFLVMYCFEVEVLFVFVVSTVISSFVKVGMLCWRTFNLSYILLRVVTTTSKSGLKED
jgi:hypothetical protein